MKKMRIWLHSRIQIRCKRVPPSDFGFADFVPSTTRVRQEESSYAHYRAATASNPGGRASIKKEDDDCGSTTQQEQATSSSTRVKEEEKSEPNTISIPDRLALGGNQVKKENLNNLSRGTMHALKALMEQSIGQGGALKSETTQESPEVREQSSIQAQLNGFRQLYNETGWFFVRGCSLGFASRVTYSTG